MHRQIRLAARPSGLPGPGCWELTTEEVPALGPGQVHVEVLWMDDVRSYVPPVGLGEVMRALAVARVVASEDERFAPGDVVTAVTGVQEHAVLGADALTAVDPDPGLAPLPTWLGALGMTGMTAYFGLLDVGALRAGDTVVESGAARIVICGAIGQYNAGAVRGPSNHMSLLVNRARMEGFLVFHYADRYGEAVRDIAGWLREGRLRSHEEVVDGGVEAFPDTLLRLFRGENTGKLVLRVAG